NEIVDKVKTAATAKIRGARVSRSAPPLRSAGSSVELIVIGASTGGVEALSELLREFPADSPPVAIVQHMPANFTARFAGRLNDAIALSVCEAFDGMTLTRGMAAIAPGNLHMTIARAQHDAFISRLQDLPPASGHKPSVDILFDSVARLSGRIVGILL